MYNAFQLIAKYGAHILFIVLEIICFNLIINYNSAQKKIYLNSSNVYASKIQNVRSRIDGYLSLKEVNDSLMRQNANLIENLIVIEYATKSIPNADSLDVAYDILPASICRNDIFNRNNYITLCSGRRHGIDQNMGVIESSIGIVGIVKNVTENFAQVMSILNSQTKISCSIKNKNSFGTLVWKDMDQQYMTLQDIPKHHKVSIGDTVITSGYSTVFPRGILVGKIEKYDIEIGSNSYTMKVRLFNDLSKLNYAYVIKNRFSNEQLSLESQEDRE
ncbi:MAG: rod shape-determining protein MreC [Saprospiraceae bacterium]